MNYSQLQPKAGGYTAAKYYHSAQVPSLSWCSCLHKSPVTKVLFSFEYTEQQELGYCASLGGRLSSDGVRLLAHPVWGVLAVWVSLQEGP